jgi:hypothetical protein
MEINSIKRSVKALLIFILATIFSSCESLDIVNCSSCFDDPPDETSLYVKINGNNFNHDNVVIDIYDGDYEDNILRYTYNLRGSSDTPIQLPVNKKYTFTATYLVDGNSYIVFDIITPMIEYSPDGCDTPCYYVKGDQVNLKLNYTE